MVLIANAGDAWIRALQRILGRVGPALPRAGLPIDSKLQLRGRRIGLSDPSTIWHLRRLESAGLVGRDKLGRKGHYYAVGPGSATAPYDERAAIEVA